ncbi:MAG TPA: hypothetical protein P5269_02570 [Syntrophales bacterium]|nr:hypothetical protein [Syntrophales bacterium]
MKNEKTNSGHRWKFFRAGGFDQVRIASGEDLLHLPLLDQKLWVALSCPVTGIEFDPKTASLIDTDGDGRIRVPEILAAVRWACELLKDPDELTKGNDALPLAAINEEHPEGPLILNAARRILENRGRGGEAFISVADTSDAEAVLSQEPFNGDGIITEEACDGPQMKAVVGDIISAVGGETDRSGKPGISGEKLDLFFAEAAAYLAWLQEGEEKAADLLTLGDDTAAAAAALAAVEEKIDDFFARCRLAAFDSRALEILKGQEQEYLSLADKNLSVSLPEAASLPLAAVNPDGLLPLDASLNPAWRDAMENFRQKAVRPLLGDAKVLGEGDWRLLKDKLGPYRDWLSRKGGALVEPLGKERLQQIAVEENRSYLASLIARDQERAGEFDALVLLDRLARYHRDLLTLLNNFVSFSDFYTRKKKAVFQAGTLYLDGRGCELCVKVEDMAAHGTLAALSRIYLAYCECKRRGGEERMTIAAAFTAGDSDYLMVGRNGVFYDREGKDWDATIVKIIEHPISIRQAFWSPYKRLTKMIQEMIAKRAAARDRAVMEQAAQKVEAAPKMEAAKPPAAPPFDIAKFAGVFAAIGLAFGAIGTAVTSVVTGFFRLSWWQMPLALAAVVLLISGPAMVMAWLKLRQRNLGPILDACGWAINSRVKINVTFGASLTKTASLPKGSLTSLEDPFADKKIPWLKILLFVVLLILAILFVIRRWGLWS